MCKQWCLYNSCLVIWHYSSCVIQNYLSLQHSYQFRIIKHLTCIWSNLVVWSFRWNIKNVLKSLISICIPSSQCPRNFLALFLLLNHTVIQIPFSYSFCMLYTIYLYMIEATLFHDSLVIFIYTCMYTKLYVYIEYR